MKTLVCVHGFLGSTHDFEQVRETFNKEYKVLCINSPLNLRKFSLKQFALDLYEKLQEARIAKAIFIGYSMGGRVLMELYRLHPEVFEKLVLISTSPGIQDPHEREMRLTSDLRWAEMIQKSVKQKQPEVFFEKWYGQELFASFRQNPSYEIHLQMRREKLSDKHAEIILEASPGGNPDHFDLLGQIQIPVLVLLGELDQKYRTIWSNLIAKLPNFKLEIIPHSGHVAHLENTADTIKRLKEFI